MEHLEMKFKVRSTAWRGWNLWGNNEVKLF
jgi:hypothetical protein